MDEELDAPPASPPQRTGPGFALLLVVVTLVAGAAGGASGLLQADRIIAIAEERANVAPARDQEALAWSEKTAVARLEPVITNIAEPARMFVRLDTAIVFDREAVTDVERMKAVVSEDMLAFLRTLSLGDLSGASAFNHLRDDLNDRARLVSGGTVRELVIETMVLQ